MFGFVCMRQASSSQFTNHSTRWSHYYACCDTQQRIKLDTQYFVHVSPPLSICSVPAGPRMLEEQSVCNTLLLHLLRHQKVLLPAEDTVAPLVASSSSPPPPALSALSHFEVNRICFMTDGIYFHSLLFLFLFYFLNRKQYVSNCNHLFFL